VVLVWISNSIEPSEYQQIKSEARQKIIYLESELMLFNASLKNIENILESATEKICRQDKLYSDSGVSAKRQSYV
ncbi:hypothetical protein, partial [Chitinophaga sp.]|uniref:hypothetical protein n=1 Tax=Chitinophaga sp. TaxID=1869181 RepID=UPI002F944DB8